ncbi:CsbD family protein [Sphingomonas sp. BAUL-RG-20F-R05-02]|uniref:CsbD family protein n=1 Tax=Sphingomonas sp. BAUL-RG-20F-R05-02 TaxID=2914830 RepID=UPI001F5690DE|nr:CsbD family protein [Sphingomonas sp. BAUL-RG-20F-R05-02]
MPDQPPKTDADHTRGLIKEAIGKITDDPKAIHEGAAEKIAAEAKELRAEAEKRADVHDDRAEMDRQ